MTIHVADGAAQERAKYAEIWGIEAYQKAHSPGEENVDRFMKVMQPQQGKSLLDIGCGAGRAGLAFKERGLNIGWLDITSAALDPRVDVSQFIESPLWGRWPGGLHYDYGYCCDVMEHIPTEYVMLSVERILAACDVAWLQISNLPDQFGALIGEPLHLTVQPFNWWKVRLATVGTIIDARDLCGMSLFVVRS